MDGWTDGRVDSWLAGWRFEHPVLIGRHWTSSVPINCAAPLAHLLMCSLKSIDADAVVVAVAAAVASATATYTCVSFAAQFCAFLRRQLINVRWLLARRLAKRKT